MKQHQRPFAAKEDVPANSTVPSKCWSGVPVASLAPEISQQRKFLFP